MPWCPKCKCEYRNEITNCSECGSPLVDEIQYAAISAEIEKKEDEGVDDRMVLLTSVASDLEARVLESELASFEIPSIKESRGIDGIYGFSLSGVNLYVPESMLSNARDVLKNQSE